MVDAGRFFALAASSAFSLLLAHALDALFHFAHAGRDIRRACSCRVELICAAERFGAVLHAVEDADVPQAAAVVEQVVPGERGIHFHGHRRIGRLPGDVRAVGQREVGLVVAGHGLLAGQHDAGLRRVVAHVVGDHLIHADAGVDDGALLKCARRRAGCRSARDECPGRWRLVEEAVDDVDLLFSGSSGSSVLLSFMAAPAPSAAPVILVDAVAQEHHGEALALGGRPPAPGIGEKRRAMQATAAPWSRRRRAGWRGG